MTFLTLNPCCQVPGCRNWAMRGHTHCRPHRDPELGPRGAPRATSMPSVSASTPSLSLRTISTNSSTPSPAHPINSPTISTSPSGPSIAAARTPSRPSSPSRSLYRLSCPGSPTAYSSPSPTPFSSNCPQPGRAGSSTPSGAKPSSSVPSASSSTESSRRQTHSPPRSRWLLRAAMGKTACDGSGPDTDVFDTTHAT